MNDEKIEVLRKGFKIERIEKIPEFQSLFYCYKESQYRGDNEISGGRLKALVIRMNDLNNKTFYWKIGKGDRFTNFPHQLLMNGMVDIMVMYDKYGNQRWYYNREINGKSLKDVIKDYYNDINNISKPNKEDNSYYMSIPFSMIKRFCFYEFPSTKEVIFEKYEGHIKQNENILLKQIYSILPEGSDRLTESEVTEAVLIGLFSKYNIHPSMFLSYADQGRTFLQENIHTILRDNSMEYDPFDFSPDNKYPLFWTSKNMGQEIEEGKKKVKHYYFRNSNFKFSDSIGSILEDE